MDIHLSTRHAGLRQTVFPQKQEVTRPKNQMVFHEKLNTWNVAQIFNDIFEHSFYKILKEIKQENMQRIKYEQIFLPIYQDFIYQCDESHHWF